ncbi:MAG: hypothetical protein ACUVQ0_02290 [Thermoproteota archaeon]
MVQRMLKDIVLKTVEVYNKYRSPEAKASFIAADDRSFTLDFEGPFCMGCGFLDYLEDFIHELKELAGIEAEIVELECYEPGRFRVKYVIKSV